MPTPMEDAPSETDTTPEKADTDPDAWGGAPLRSTLKLLAVPGVLFALIIVLGIPLPTWALYGIGGLFAIVLLPRMWREPELLLAIVIVYLPLNKLFVVPIAPGVNATNILFALLIVSAFREGRERTEAEAPVEAPRPPASRLVAAYATVSLLSVVTAAVVAGLDFVVDRGGDLKQWIDQFIVFFTCYRLIRDDKMARRVLVYMMVAATIVLALGFQEWLEKRDASSIEKARLLGPQLQPNDFGAYMAYAAAPFIALLLNNIGRPRILAVCIPYLVVTARILLATFSRGAYLGVALAGVIAGYVRGRMFLIGAAVAGALLVVAVPQIVPESLQARMGQTASGDASGGEKLDTSSQTRLILWDAAFQITKRSPLFGYGFKTFPKFKGDFTDTPVLESDNHNMYLYLSSQMGVPAAVLLLLIMWRMGSLGVRVYRASEERFARVVGMTAVALAAAAFLVNMFGSRMVDICVSVNFWITLAVISRMWVEIEKRRISEQAR
jgi:putative inorganic carbon (HCO3(-)) transporter